MLMNKSYFGYGERTPETMASIIGRTPERYAAVLPGFRLFVQRVVDLSPAVRNIIGTHRTDKEIEDFKVYAAKRSEDGYLRGLVYTDITPDEFALIDNFDVEGLWFSRHTDQPVSVFNADGTNRLGTVDVHADPQGELMIPSNHFTDLFPPPLSDPSRTIEIATLVRMDFLAR
jgi:hypothetical protein